MLMRRLLLLCLLLCVFQPLAWPVEKEPPDVFRARRVELARRSPGIVVLFGRVEVGEAINGFQQSPDFYYLTGIDEPGAVFMIVPAAPAQGEQAPGPAAQAQRPQPRQILFLPARSRGVELFMGARMSADDPATKEKTGFDSVLPMAALEGELRNALASINTVYTVLPSGKGPDEFDLERDRVEKLRVLSPFTQIRDLSPAVAQMRQRKSPGEIALMEKAAKASVDAHLAAMRAVQPGMFEYEVSAAMQYTWLREGCEAPAYAPIVGSGPNATVLHYSANRRRMEAGDLVVMDVAAQCDAYASDITRTLPVSGKFTPRQREVYEVVLGAQKAAIAAIKPGVTIGGFSNEGAPSLTKIARDYMDAHGKDLKGQPLGRYFVHGLSHGVGLEVHDPTDTVRPLQAGMVITIEPGIYIPEENIGIRIEDTVLVTETGAKVLTEALPKDPDAVERIMASRPH